MYLGLHPLTPWAELLRATDRRTLDEVRFFRPITWAARVLAESDDIIELTFDTAPNYGLSPDDLVSDDYRACQAFSAGLRADPDAQKIVVAPSAALPGTKTMVLLGRRVHAPYDLDPNYDPSVDTSVAPTATLGSSLFSVVNAIHYKRSGTTHAGLDAWYSGDDYDFQEPRVSSDEYGVA
jgi:RES domain-containing protein